MCIDDLDRIDPEHIFRILNVLAAHFDIEGGAHTNKFGFDRIVVVCDIQNIRRMFRSRYGQDTDFSGYIDKFYSKRVFNFENLKALEEEVSNIVYSMDIRTYLPRQAIEIEWGKLELFPILIYTLLGLIRVRALHLRSLWRQRQGKYRFKAQKFTSNSSPNDYSYVVGVLELLIEIMGDAEMLEEGLILCKDARISEQLPVGNDRNNIQKTELLLPILELALRNTKHTPQAPRGGASEEPIAAFYKQQVFPHNNSPIDIFPALLEAVQILQNLKLLP